MCIAILNKQGSTIAKKTLKRCWDNNPDGAGMIYNDKEILTISKEMDSFKTFYKQYKQVRDNCKGYIAIHFRISTHGAINMVNCHPFKVNNSLAFVHNGMIDKMPKDKNFSDTYLFNETILKKLPTDFLKSEAVRELIAEYIGYSKLVFLDDKNNYTIINESLGSWDGENWYSNDSYLSDEDYYKNSASEYKSNYNYNFNASYNLSKECEECGAILEKSNATYCNFCLDDAIMIEEKNMCDMCCANKGDYISTYHATLCNICLEEINNPETICS